MLLEAFIERRESFWLSWAVKGIAAAVWKQRLSIFKLDTKPTRYPPNRQQCPILVCSFVCTKAAPVGCACRRNATDYGSLPIWKAFSTLNRPRLIFFIFRNLAGNWDVTYYVSPSSSSPPNPSYHSYKTAY